LREHAETLALLFTDRWNFSRARNILYKGAAASTLYGVKVNWSSIETSLISYDTKLLQLLLLLLRNTAVGQLFHYKQQLATRVLSGSGNNGDQVRTPISVLPEAIYSMTLSAMMSAECFAVMQLNCRSDECAIN